jgi:hypothetical protein
MCTIRHPLHSLVPLVGTGLMLVSLVGCLTLSAGSVPGFEPTAYHEDRYPWGHRDSWGHRDPWDHRDSWRHRYDRSYRRRGFAPPDRYTIHKGKKCELRCERIWGTRDYRCREYRC